MGVIEKIIMGFVALVILTGMLPALNAVIANATENTDSVTGVMLRMIPMFFVILIIAGIFAIRKYNPYGQDQTDTGF